ncbi:DUF883 family protein [Pararhizobium gei]|uniref:DUF883 family protein n=1 Tax=Pararhizobium gei TaxID=1395951 RepID=UPI0023DAAABF|nr:hypothetical protein [Rhizobium gei]
MAAGLFSGSSAKKRFAETPIEDQVAELRHELASIGKMLSRRSAQASGEVKARAHDVRDQAEASLSDLLENSEQILSDLRDRFAVTERQVRTTVREHPVATLGAAAAFGLLIAVLISRR